MKLKPYPKTKPSGVEWLGDVPDHWDVKRLKTEATCFVSNVDKVPSEDELPVRLCNYTDVYYNDRITPDMGLMETTATIDEIRRFGLKVADVLITKDSEDWTDIAVPALVSETAPDLVCGYHLGIIRSRSPRLFGDYLLRAFQSCAVNQQFQIAASGVTRYGLPKSAIGNSWLPFPTPAEQTAIAAYLDRETGRIDELVGKKRELIERLKEKRTALISRTVTRGIPADLPPETLARLEAIAGEHLPINAPLKPSGIDWLGEIPEHWEVRPLFRITSAIQTGPFGSQLHAGDYVEGGIPLINPAHIVDGRLLPDELSAVDELTFSRLRRHMLIENDIVMARRGEIGRCAVVGQHEVGWLCGTGSLVVRLHQGSSKYYWRIISGAGFSSLLQLNAVGTTMLNLNPTIVGRMLVPVPPRPEQLAIAAYLDEETAKFDALVARVETAIERLQEYRTALITAAVTGKIDVGEEAMA